MMPTHLYFHFSGPKDLIDKISKVILSGVSKLIGVESTEPADIQNAAYCAMAQLARKCPEIVNKDLQLTVAYFNHLTQAPTELHDSIREALIAIAPAFQWNGDADETTEGTSNAVNFVPNSNQKLLLAMLSEHAESKSIIVQNVTCTFLTTCFPEHYVPARYLLLLIAGERYVNFFLIFLYDFFVFQKNLFFFSIKFLSLKLSFTLKKKDHRYVKQLPSICTECRKRITSIIRTYQQLKIHRVKRMIRSK